MIRVHLEHFVSVKRNTTVSYFSFPRIQVYIECENLVRAQAMSSANVFKEACQGNLKPKTGSQNRIFT